MFPKCSIAKLHVPFPADSFIYRRCVIDSGARANECSERPDTLAQLLGDMILTGPVFHVPGIRRDEEFLGHGRVF
jgi:hypothetical protein